MAELITNGSFSGNDNGWTVGSDWSYGGNREVSLVQSPGGIGALAPDFLAVGSGYTVGDILTFADAGDGNAQMRVTVVDSFGAVQDTAPVNIGSGYASGWVSSPTGGTGTGVQFTAVFNSSNALSQQITVSSGASCVLTFDFGQDNFDGAVYIVVREGATQATSNVLTVNSPATGITVGFNASVANTTLFFYTVGTDNLAGSPPWSRWITNVSVTSSLNLAQDVSIVNGDTYKFSFSADVTNSGPIQVFQGTQLIYDTSSIPIDSVSDTVHVADIPMIVITGPDAIILQMEEDIMVTEDLNINP